MTGLTGTPRVRPSARLALVALLSSLFCLGLVDRAVAEPAAGFDVSLHATGSFSRDGVYNYADGDYSEHGTVSTDGSYSADGATFAPVMFPAAGTDKRTANFPTDQGAASFSGDVTASETYSDTDGGSEDSSCSAPFVSTDQDVFALAYRGIAGKSFEVFVAPTVYANRDGGAISCVAGDNFAADQLLFTTQASIDGMTRLLDPPFEVAKTITITQQQLKQPSFSVPVSFSNSGNQSWAQTVDPPHGYCEVSVPADDSGSCSWTHTWNGTLKFKRVCAAGDGSVSFSSPQRGRDGITRWFANGGCSGGGGGGGGACLVPKLKGKSLKAAKKKLKAANCKLGKVTKGKSKKIAKGLIIKQSPKPGARKPSGAKVNVKLSKGRG